MARERVGRRVAQKEVLLFFSSPVAWLFLASFTATTFFIFFWVESFFARNVADVRPLFEWMPVLLIFSVRRAHHAHVERGEPNRHAGAHPHPTSQPLAFCAGQVPRLLCAAVTGADFALCRYR